MERKLSRKEITHDRIVETAARAIRRGGYDGIGVADIMKEAGLTHGGFYAHFDSRDALLAEAVERAGRDSAGRLERSVEAGRQKGASALRALLESYLSDSHMSSAEAGCPVAALGSEMARQPPAVRAASADRVQALVRLVRQTLPATASPSLAVLIASAMVGALQLSRAMDDKRRAKAMLKSAREALLSQYDN
jgi:TetR/AcrR family transcriptional repressor of nem operon